MKRIITRQKRQNASAAEGRRLELGARLRPGGKAFFCVWAPRCQQMEVKLFRPGKTKTHPMKKDEAGYFSAELEDIKAGVRYFYVLDGSRERPDPVSRYQPEGVHGPSEVTDPQAFVWKDKAWKGRALQEMLFYELHTGTFTPEGTLDSAIAKLPYLKKLGVTCVEVMPVAQFPGKRNWGYDGVGLYAVQNSYGGPEALKRLVNACHKEKLAVCLDVVYNHLGPEGNYLHDYGYYFTDKHHTPWGEALNYDGPGSPHVRRFIIENALYWITEYHIDALRLDAVHSIYDFGAYHILEELKDCVRVQSEQLGREVLVIAESDLNDPRIVREKKEGGYGLDAQWSDDFHHALHVCLTGEKAGYYKDFSGFSDLAKALKDHFVFDWKYSDFRQRFHGAPAGAIPMERFVHCIQNHDQVGNRAWGDRINTHLSFEAQKLAAVLVILGPHIPFIWMGQEYGEKAPFQYFIDHADLALVDAVRKGRKREFEEFGWKEIPDPAGEETFLNSKLRWDLQQEGRHALLLKLYRDLITLRRTMGVLVNFSRKDVKVKFDEEAKWISLEYPAPGRKRYGILASFEDKERVVKNPFRGAPFQEVLNTEDEGYGGFLARNRARRHGGEILLNTTGAIIGRTS